MPSITPFNMEIPDFINMLQFGKIYETDIKQKTIVDATIIEQYLPWLILVLLLNFKRQKKPVVYLLISFWLVRFLNSVISGYSFFSFDNENNGKDSSFSMMNFVLFALTNCLIMIAQVIGDWYPVLRTKAVVHNKKSIKLVYFTCIIYNIAKLMGLLSFVVFPPSEEKFRDYIEEQFKKQQEMQNTQKMQEIKESIKHDPSFSPASQRSMGDSFGPFGTMGTVDQFEDTNSPFRDTMFYLYICIGISFLASIFYDLSIIYVLKKEVFNKIKIDEQQFPNMKKRSFLEKFKLMSEYRIYVSMFVTLIAIPTIFVYISTFFLDKYGNESIKYSLFPFCMYIFSIVMKFNYCIMFIDQILLRYYAERNNPNIVIANTKHSKSNYSFTSTIPRTPGLSYTPRTLNYSSLKSTHTTPTNMTDESTSVITFSNNSHYSPFSPNVNNFDDTASSTANTKISVNVDGEYHFLNKNNFQFTSLPRY